MTPCVLHFTCVTKSQSVYTEMTKKRKTFQEDNVMTPGSVSWIKSRLTRNNT